MRLEHDSLGSLEVPNFAYYGIQTERNRQAFDISDLTLEDFPSFIEAVAKIKAACARTNLEIGALDKEKAQAIEQAAWEVIRRCRSEDPMSKCRNHCPSEPNSRQSTLTRKKAG